MYICIWRLFLGELREPQVVLRIIHFCAVSSAIHDVLRFYRVPLSGTTSRHHVLPGVSRSLVSFRGRSRVDISHNPPLENVLHSSCCMQPLHTCLRCVGQVIAGKHCQ